MRLWLLLPVLMALVCFAPAAHTAPKPSNPPLTKHQKQLIQIALARALPASLTTAQRALLTATKTHFAAGETGKAKTSYGKFLAAVASAKLTSAEFDIVERWVAREAVLIGHKELDELAYKLGKSELALAALGAHRAKLIAIGAKPPTVNGKWSIEIVAVEGGEVVSKGKRSVTRNQLGDTIKVLEAKSEEIRNQREMNTTAFQNADQKSNQLMNMLTQILKTLYEMRLSSSSKSGL